MGSRWARATRGFPRCEGSRRRIVPTGGREDGLLGYGRCHQQKWGCVYAYIYYIYRYRYRYRYRYLDRYRYRYIYIFYHRRSLPSKILKILRISLKKHHSDSATKRSWMSKNGDSEVDFTNEARDRSPKKHQKTPFLSWQQAWKGTSWYI